MLPDHRVGSRQRPGTPGPIHTCTYILYVRYLPTESMTACMYFVYNGPPSIPPCRAEKGGGPLITRDAMEGGGALASRRAARRSPVSRPCRLPPAYHAGHQQHTSNNAAAAHQPPLRNQPANPQQASCRSVRRAVRCAVRRAVRRAVRCAAPTCRSPAQPAAARPLRHLDRPHTGRHSRMGTRPRSHPDIRDTQPVRSSMAASHRFVAHGRVRLFLFSFHLIPATTANMTSDISHFNLASPSSQRPALLLPCMAVQHVVTYKRYTSPVYGRTSYPNNG